MNYICTTCGKAAESPGHLCSPCDEASSCCSCGVAKNSVLHTCQSEPPKAQFVCADCGMVSERQGQLCNPEPIAE